jgi:hypothetical protein
LVVVIGRDWLSAQDEDGHRRLDQTDDFVRLEIETALRRGVRVIPILVDGSRMPRAIDLPDSIKALSRRNGRDISNARFNSDCLELISTLERILGAESEGQAGSAGAEATPQGNAPKPETRVYSSNEFNVQVTSAIRQIWFNCFNEKIHEKQDIILQSRTVA